MRFIVSSAAALIQKSTVTIIRNSIVSWQKWSTPIKQEQCLPLCASSLVTTIQYSEIMFSKIFFVLVLTTLIFVANGYDHPRALRGNMIRDLGPALPTPRPTRRKPTRRPSKRPTRRKPPGKPSKRPTRKPAIPTRKPTRFRSKKPIKMPTPRPTLYEFGVLLNSWNGFESAVTCDKIWRLW
jgi:hypothetical protein